jgi:Tfp pilus assembly protein PilN
MPMIRINLLPPAYRKAPASSVQQFFRSPLAAILVAVSLGAAGLLAGAAKARQVRLSELQDRTREVEPRRLAIEELLKSVQLLREQKVIMERVVQVRSQWARRLNQLSNVTPEGVWFTDLMLDQDKGLVLQGSAVGQGGTEMVQIGRLAQDLKADAVFSAAVKDIQIQSIESVQERETEVVKFTLTGSLVAGGGGS